MTIDWVKVTDWLIGGGISLVFGVIGGFIGSWINYSFEKRREKETREREKQDEIRQTLTRGVSAFMYEQSKREPMDHLFVPPSSPQKVESRHRGYRKITFFNMKAFIVGSVIALVASIIVLTTLGFW